MKPSPTLTLPNITTIVLTWNSEAFIANCIDSLLRSTIKTNIVVVDNDSADTTRDLLKTRYPDIPVINSGNNLGYAGGNNIGIQYGIEHGADYLFILNPDAYIDPSCIERLYQRLRSEPTLGGVSPKIYFHGGTTIWFAGSTINWRTGVTEQFGGEDTGQYDTKQYTERLNGCAMMIPATVFKTVGMITDEYFLYYEETDWSVTATRTGLKLGLVPSALVWHENSSSTGGYLSPLYQYYMTRNKLYFIKKFKPFSLPTVALLLAYTSMQNIYVAYREVGLKRAYVLTKSITKACANFLGNKMGKQTIPQ